MPDDFDASAERLAVVVLRALRGNTPLADRTRRALFDAFPSAPESAQIDMVQVLAGDPHRTTSGFLATAVADATLAPAVRGRALDALHLGAPSQLADDCTRACLDSRVPILRERARDFLIAEQSTAPHQYQLQGDPSPGALPIDHPFALLAGCLAGTGARIFRGPAELARFRMHAGESAAFQQRCEDLFGRWTPDPSGPSTTLVPGNDHLGDSTAATRLTAECWLPAPGRGSGFEAPPRVTVIAESTAIHTAGSLLVSLRIPIQPGVRPSDPHAAKEQPPPAAAQPATDWSNAIVVLLDSGSRTLLAWSAVWADAKGDGYRAQPCGQIPATEIDGPVRLDARSVLAYLVHASWRPPGTAGSRWP